LSEVTAATTTVTAATASVVQPKQLSKIKRLADSELLAKSIIERTTADKDKKEYNKKVNKIERRARKTALKQYLNRAFRRRKKKYGRKGRGDPPPGMKEYIPIIRTRYEFLFEKYLKALGTPFLINQVMCFRCGNFYQYTSSFEIPKYCAVCKNSFHTKARMVGDKTLNIVPRSYLSRPDFILDFNNRTDRIRYSKDCQRGDLLSISQYVKEYFSKVAMVRIDGGVHMRKYQRIKDYHQYNNYKERGIKVFIVQNDELDEMVERRDECKGILKLCDQIAKATVNERLYERYCSSPDFKERVNCPF
jgi:hypothetical protein